MCKPYVEHLVYLFVYAHPMDWKWKRERERWRKKIAVRSWALPIIWAWFHHSKSFPFFSLRSNTRRSNSKLKLIGMMPTIRIVNEFKSQVILTRRNLFIWMALDFILNSFSINLEVHTTPKNRIVSFVSFKRWLYLYMCVCVFESGFPDIPPQNMLDQLENFGARYFKWDYKWLNFNKWEMRQKQSSYIEWQ